MSAAGRVVLLIVSLSVAAYVVSPPTGTDVAGPHDRAQQGGETIKAASSFKSMPNWSVEPSSSFIEPTVVTIAERPVERSVLYGQPPVSRSRDALARELQKELKRVGCYSGELNGAWTASTRQAMNAFSDRVNAKLPTDRPDNILLALVQGQSNKVCGAPCPSGQSLSRTQQCTPNALLTRAGEIKFSAAAGQRSAQPSSAWTVKATVAGEASNSQEQTEHSGDIAPGETSSFSASAPLHAPQRVAKRHWQSTPNHVGPWASTFLKQRSTF
jgi:hypothetical protein